jgi:hypothetical protein
VPFAALLRKPPRYGLLVGVKPGILLVLLGVGMCTVGALWAGGRIHIHARGGPWGLVFVGVLVIWNGIFLRRERTDEPPPP